MWSVLGLAKRLIEIDQLERETAENIHRLAQGVCIHAKNAGLTDLNVLFDNIDWQKVRWRRHKSRSCPAGLAQHSAGVA